MNKDLIESFQQKVRNKFLFKLFLLKELPMGFIAGLRVINIRPESCTVQIPFKFLNKNPFRSIYFAAQSMPAEMATGLLAMSAIYNSNPPVSMLVANMEGEFTKKATSRVSFTCNDGQKIIAAIEESKQTGKGVKVEATSIGVDESGRQVSKFKFTWTFKAKKSKPY